MARVAELAPSADAIVVNGMPNFRRSDGLPQRMISRLAEMEALTGKPVVASDGALYWRIFKTLGLALEGDHGCLLKTLG